MIMTGAGANGGNPQSYQNVPTGCTREPTERKAADTNKNTQSDTTEPLNEKSTLVSFSSTATDRPSDDKSDLNKKTGVS
ncbi:unnamed protein product [Didymodactylos carnosus]|uniref:Uncharacterized protein n=1 Tax=Didymodactylos carnosus TaxID=1234261 RepID=A0A814BSQ2_9BILA|nr:unnamed protein product [Didymodactylos carnosus]CAF3709746.1 unnamed protein product [Didymodactylos carnosus]